MHEVLTVVLVELDCSGIVLFIFVRNRMTFRRGGGAAVRGRFGPREDRGRPGGREGGPPRSGDRLSNHTSDASMANARIFVGKLPTNDARLTKELLEESFSKFGHILGNVRYIFTLGSQATKLFRTCRHFDSERIRFHSILGGNQRRECHSRVTEPGDTRPPLR